jgi:hypothetical protein
METCLSADEWVKIMADGCKGILFCHKKNATLLLATIWMEVELIMLSKISQAQKDKCHMMSLGE